MKILSIFLVLLITFSCNVIDEPLTKAIGGAGDCSIPTFPINTNTKRNVLVEDFTGHKCTGCPTTAYKIDTLYQNAGDQIIPVAMHVNEQFAGVNPSDAPKYQLNLMTDAGSNTYSNFTPLPGAPLPAVMISRIDTLRSPVRFYHGPQDLFTEMARKIMRLTPVINMQIIVNFDSSSSKICAFAESEILKSLSDDHSIIFMLLEDSIVGWQDFNGVGGDPAYSSGEIHNFVHKHVLRKIMNGWEGKKIITPSNTIGEKIIEGSSFTITNSTWRTNHLEVVAFVYNNRTKEVMQAVKTKL